MPSLASGLAIVFFLILEQVAVEFGIVFAGIYIVLQSFGIQEQDGGVVEEI